MKKVKYVGRYDEVEVPAAGLVCGRGETVEVDDGLADSLLEQEGNWEPVKSGKSAGKPAGDKE